MARRRKGVREVEKKKEKKKREKREETAKEEWAEGKLVDMRERLFSFEAVCFYDPTDRVAGGGQPSLWAALKTDRGKFGGSRFP